MSNELTIFNNDKFGAIRTITDEKGEPWFCGKDVATALGYVDTDQALRNHCKEGGALKRRVIDSLGREQDTIFINEGNLYRLIMRSKLPSAEEFEKWVCEEVLPSIRKTGSYSLTKNPVDVVVYSEDPLERAKALTTILEKKKQEQLLLTQQKEQAEQKVKTIVPGSEDIMWSKWCNDICHITTPLVNFVLMKNKVYNKHKLIAKEYADCFKETPTKDGWIRKNITPKGQQVILDMLLPYMLPELLTNGKYTYKKKVLTNLGLI